MPAIMRQSLRVGRGLIALSLAVGSAVGAAPADGVATAVKDGTIGYVLTNEHWGVYQGADLKTQCPEGLNDGPREQFKVLYPDNWEKRPLLGTQLARESAVWFPTTWKETLPFHEGSGKIAIGMNLDDKVGPNDFISPDGEQGIDNQLYRAIGCIDSYRGPDGDLYFGVNRYLQDRNFNRTIIELTGVETLANSSDVIVTIYRGLDPLLTDATGNDFIPGGTQRLDLRWGKQFIQHFHGKIVAGILTTNAADMIIPAPAAFEATTIQTIHGARFRLKLTPDKAEGLMAGYADVEGFYYQLNKAWSTHLLSYGHISSPSLYKALRRLADGYPDPTTGANTAISSALEVKFVQVYIQHPPVQTASKTP